MSEEEIYDYNKGLSAPYWIQEIRTRKGKVIASFSVPIQLSYFVVFALTFVMMVTVFKPIMDFLYFFLRGVAYLLYYYVPNYAAKFYSEREIDGKPMLYFLRDYFYYFIDFGLDKKAIYQEDRVDTEKEYVFEEMPF